MIPLPLRPLSRLLVPALVCVVGLGGAHAQGTAPTSTDIIRSLAPAGPAAAGSGVTVRAPRTGQGDRVEARGPGGETVLLRVDRARTLDFDVFFPFDSADLTPAARRSLAALGQALASPALAGSSYLLAGHTDARGSAAHNDDLSRRRALAVRQYLITTFPIDPARLYVAGFGSRFPRAADAPAAAINRRVEVTLIVAR